MNIARTATAVVIGLLGATAPAAIAQPLSAGSSSATTQQAFAGGATNPPAHAVTISNRRSVAAATFRADRRDQQLQGTWMTTVSIENPRPASTRSSSRSIRSCPVGRCSCRALPRSRACAALRPRPVGPNRQSPVRVNLVWFRFDPAGAFAGTQRVRRTVSLTRALDAFHATDVVEIINPAGAVVATLHATEVGKRLAAG